VISLRGGERFLYFRIWIDLSDRHLGNEMISSEQKEYQRICLEYEKTFRTDSYRSQNFS
jgi:hypothetical protein